jgi:hypothetical protein
VRDVGEYYDIGSTEEVGIRWYDLMIENRPAARPWTCVACRKPNDPTDDLCDTPGCLGVRPENAG